MKKNEKKMKKNEKLKPSLAKKLHLQKDKSNPEKEKTLDSPAKQKNFNQQLKQSQENYLYLKAEFENFKKQSFKERQELVRYAGEAFVKSLIENALDDLERALESNADDQTLEEFQKGLQLILKKLHDTFKRFGIEIIDPVGKPFDPSYQEALSKEKTSKVADGHVSRTFKKAYKFHDKVIRPAQVIVAEEIKEDS